MAESCGVNCEVGIIVVGVAILKAMRYAGVNKTVQRGKLNTGHRDRLSPFFRPGLIWVTVTVR